jgi:hypothetical protein
MQAISTMFVIEFQSYLANLNFERLILMYVPYRHITELTQAFGVARGRPI